MNSVLKTISEQRCSLGCGVILASLSYYFYYGIQIYLPMPGFSQTQDVMQRIMDEA
tara:strand:+ start:728 stop:895 length:168 start_codon:yes stop_codon:yes gene_type:complete